MIQIYDSFQQRKVDLVPKTPGRIGMYVCGPTVYNFIHIGNACPYVVFDMVYRHLTARGFEVTYVRNITDVDDKIIARAAESKEPWQFLAKRFTDEFHQDCQTLKCLPPIYEPKATDTIPEMIAHIKGLIQKGMAYEMDGDVYFSVRNFPQYGKLTRLTLEELRTGSRVELDERKKDPADFALWKAAKPGEPAWDSPFGKGRPGWHIECSAMAEKFLGTSFDIHGGGIDLRFPHHENEIAQSEGLHGSGTFSRNWMHNGHIGFRWVYRGNTIAEGAKISKSDQKTRRLYDFFMARFAFERHGGEAVRLFLLSTHYRTPSSFDVDLDPNFDPENPDARLPGIEEAERKLEYGYLTKQRLEDALKSGKSLGEGPVLTESESWLLRFQNALDDDFNTPIALAELQQALSFANRLLDNQVTPHPSKDLRRRTLERLDQDLRQAAKHLGLFESDPAHWLAEHLVRRAKMRGLDLTEIEESIKAREQARIRKDYAEADRQRLSLLAIGVEVMDTPSGPRYRIADST